MNIDIKDIKPKLIKTYKWIRVHVILLSVLLVVLLYGWLVLQINLLNRREPSEDTVTERLQTIKRPRIDQQTIDRLEQLQDTNVDVKALFKQARDNPFQE